MLFRSGRLGLRSGVGRRRRGGRIRGRSGRRLACRLRFLDRPAVLVVLHGALAGLRLRRSALVEVLLRLVEFLLRLLGELLGFVQEAHASSSACTPVREQGTAWLGPSGTPPATRSGTPPATPFGTPPANDRIARLPMATTPDYSHRTAIQKLGVGPDQRVEV